MTVPLTAKREMVRAHFELMSHEARASAAKTAAWAAFIDYRASVVDAMPEVELDLLLADWNAARESNGRRNEASQHAGHIARTTAVFAVSASTRIPKPGEVWLHHGVDAGGRSITTEMRVCDPPYHGPRPDGSYRVALLAYPEAVCLFPLSELEFVRER